MARTKSKEDLVAQALKKKNVQLAAKLFQEIAHRIHPPKPKPNADKERMSMEITVTQDTIDVISGACPGCESRIHQPIEPDVAARLEAGRTVDATCTNCGQRYTMEKRRNRIITPQMHVMMDRAGK